jgi:hypothetical protein
MALHYRPGIGRDQINDAALAVVQLVRDILNVDADTVVSIARHHCGNPSCRDAETTVLLMRPKSPTRSIRIAKPLEAITEPDVRVALERLSNPEVAKARKGSLKRIQRLLTALIQEKSSCLQLRSRPRSPS